MIDALAARIAALPTRSIVAISGFAGAGKSTLARALVDRVPATARVRVDDFLDPARSHRRSPDWDGVDRARLRAELLDPFAAGETDLAFRPWDWERGRLGGQVPFGPADRLVVEGIGILHPDLLDLFALTIWIAAEPDDALARGLARDRLLGRDHASLWHEVWVPNDRDFAARFAPERLADVVVDPRDIDLA